MAFPGIAERQLGNLSKVIIKTRAKFAELALRDPKRGIFQLCKWMNLNEVWTVTEKHSKFERFIFAQLAAVGIARHQFLPRILEKSSASVIHLIEYSQHAAIVFWRGILVEAAARVC